MCTVTLGIKFPHALSLQDSYCIYITDVSSVTGTMCDVTVQSQTTAHVY